jgi:hypothetical protein
MGLFSASPVVQGPWFLNPQEIGPYPASGAPTATAQTTMLAATQAFDPGMAASTGDLWAESLNPSAPINPIVVGPGQTATVPVTIRPTGKPGQVVEGTLYVDDLQLLNAGFLVPNANQVAALPYSYTIK